MSVDLEKPIYQIVKAEMVLPSFVVKYQRVDENGFPFGDLIQQEPSLSISSYDITQFILEESVYNTKKTSAVELDIFEPTALDYKRMYFSYKTGNEIINNLCYTEGGFLGLTLRPAYQNIINYVIWKKLEEIHANDPLTPYGVYLASIPNYPDPRNIMFNVEFKSEGDLRFRVEKENKTNINPKLVIDSQANSYVDSDSLAIVEQEKVNRLGNDELIIKMKLDSFKDIFNFNKAKYEDYFISQYTCQIFDNVVYLEGHFNKNFIRKNMFTGIRSKARYTSIATSSEALLRKDLVKWDMWLDSVNGTEFNDFGALIFQNLDRTSFRQFQIIIKTFNNEITAISPYIGVTSSFFKLGKSIIIGFRMLDNFNANNKIVDSTTDAYTAKQVSYVDDKGEFYRIEVRFCMVEERVNSSNYNKWLEWSKNLPEFTQERMNTINNQQLVVYNVIKDNREIYGTDFQINFKSKDQNIILYDYFYDCLPFIKQDKSIQLFKQIDDTKYDSTDTILKGIFEKKPLLAEDIVNNKITHFNELGKSWGVCDSNNKLLIANNSDSDIFLTGGNFKLC